VTSKSIKAAVFRYQLNYSGIVAKSLGFRNLRAQFADSPINVY